eukprot:gene293-biopygen8979
MKLHRYGSISSVDPIRCLKPGCLKLYSGNAKDRLLWGRTCEIGGGCRLSLKVDGYFAPEYGVRTVRNVVVSDKHLPCLKYKDIQRARGMSHAAVNFDVIRWGSIGRVKQIADTTCTIPPGRVVRE